MTNFPKVFSKLLLAASVALLVPTLAIAQAQPVDARTQGPADLSANNETATASPLPDPPQQQPSSADDSWHFDVAPYIWVPGIHGTVGALGQDASVHVSGSDVLSDFQGGISGFLEARKGRIVIPIDLIYYKIASTQGLPLNELGQTAVRVGITEGIYTPKIGYRIIDGEHFKVDALFGARIWHEGLNLTLRPSELNASRSSNWADAVAGGRFEYFFTPKVWITASGDAGGGGAGLDYQGVGIINFQPKPLFGFFLGWRYLDVNYSKFSRGYVFDLAQTGPMAGLNFQFGGKPPVPPTASCSASPAEVWAGDPVSASINTQNFNPKHTLTYNWTATGGKISGTTTTANVDTAGLAPGSYAVKGTATDEKEKKNNIASCEASFAVKAKPMNPPQVSCSASPSTVKSGDPSTITATANSPDNAQITGYAYQASAGRISGTGTTATLDTTGAPSGPISVTVTATDARNLTGTGSCSVGVEVPLPPPTCSKINSIQFPDLKRPWRVDNTAKAILDDVASRLKADPNAKIVIVGYADGEKAPMVGTGRNRHPMDLAGQRAVNAKAYLVHEQGIDASRVEVRQGTGQQQIADIMWVPQGADENACADLQNTTPVNESVVMPSENAYPKPRKAPATSH